VADRRRRRWRLGARVAARKLLARTREVLLTEPTESDGLAAERAGAETLAGSAGELRGGVAKVAQMTAYFRGPEAAASAAARESLSALWDAARPMEPERSRAVVEAELGAPIDELFGSWDDRPMAAASIGQVHRATDRDGRPLAVKVQYPEVADALRSDLASGRLVRQLAGAGAGRHLEEAAVAAIRDAVDRELDYRAEAAALDRFRAAFAGDPDIVIPAPEHALSTERVLAMERLDGRPLARVAGGGSETTRREVARILLRFAWESPLRHGLVNADPNPGNYLVIGDDAPRVGFLDFGCTVELTDHARATDRALWQAMLASDAFAAAEQFRSTLVDRGLVGDARLLHSERFRDWERVLTAPVLTRTGFVWDADYADQLTRATGRLVAAGDLRLGRDLVMLWRQRLGVAAVLGSLAVETNLRGCLRGC
jgi:predicted unusual protein kinase regulating ubiquinone biosynthesis (AarF/ABC1/UbiB family)